MSWHKFKGVGCGFHEFEVSINVVRERLEIENNILNYKLFDNFNLEFFSEFNWAYGFMTNQEVKAGGFCIVLNCKWFEGMQSGEELKPDPGAREVYRISTSP